MAPQEGIRLNPDALIPYVGDSDDFLVNVTPPPAPSETAVYAAWSSLGDLGASVTSPMIRRALIAAYEAQNKSASPWSAPGAYSRQVSAEQSLGDEIARVGHGQDGTASDLANRLRPWLMAHDAEVRAAAVSDPPRSNR